MKMLSSVHEFRFRVILSIPFEITLRVQMRESHPQTHSDSLSTGR